MVKSSPTFWALPIIKYEANLSMKKSVDHEAWEGKGSHIYKEEYFPSYSQGVGLSSLLQRRDLHRCKVPSKWTRKHLKVL